MNMDVLPNSVDYWFRHSLANIPPHPVDDFVKYLAEDVKNSI
jgi:predicted transcriptional regulator